MCLCMHIHFLACILKVAESFFLFLLLTFFFSPSFCLLLFSFHLNGAHLNAKCLYILPANIYMHHLWLMLAPQLWLCCRNTQPTSRSKHPGISINDNTEKERCLTLAGVYASQVLYISISICIYDEAQNICMADA